MIKINHALIIKISVNEKSLNQKAFMNKR